MKLLGIRFLKIAGPSDSLKNANNILLYTLSIIWVYTITTTLYSVINITTLVSVNLSHRKRLETDDTSKNAKVSTLKGWRRWSKVEVAEEMQVGGREVLATLGNRELSLWCLTLCIHKFRGLELDAKADKDFFKKPELGEKREKNEGQILGKEKEQVKKESVLPGRWGYSVSAS